MGTSDFFREFGFQSFSKSAKSFKTIIEKSYPHDVHRWITSFQIHPSQVIPTTCEHEDMVRVYSAPMLRRRYTSYFATSTLPARGAGFSVGALKQI
jgi:hypothetical protein